MKHWRTDKNGYFTENEDTHDFLEVQYMAYMAYGSDEYINAIVECYFKNNISYNPTRYPLVSECDTAISRDHVIYSICAIKHKYGKNWIEKLEEQSSQK